MKTISDYVKKAEDSNFPLSSVIINEQLEGSTMTESEIIAEMSSRYSVMRDAVEKGCRTSSKSITGLSGGDAFLADEYIKSGKSVSGALSTRIIRNALAVSEVNASMGRIVAAPTAGSCGIIPGLLTVLEDEKGIERSDIVLSLFTAAGFGSVISMVSTLSGAEGGCQAECGSAAAMAAAAGCEVLGGTPSQCANAFSLSLINSLGLVCDPVGGYVEYPCVYRNAIGAVNALAALEMALAGIKSIIPADEVILAMKDVGNKMHSSLKETSLGGLASAESACKFCRKDQDL